MLRSDKEILLKSHLGMDILYVQSFFFGGIEIEEQRVWVGYICYDDDGKRKECA